MVDALVEGKNDGNAAKGLRASVLDNELDLEERAQSLNVCCQPQRAAGVVAVVALPVREDLGVCPCSLKSQFVQVSLEDAMHIDTEFLLTLCLLDVELCTLRHLEGNVLLWWWSSGLCLVRFKGGRTWEHLDDDTTALQDENQGSVLSPVPTKLHAGDNIVYLGFVHQHLADVNSYLTIG